MAWILAIASSWLFVALLLYYLYLCFDYYFFTYDLLERRAAQWLKHPDRVLVTLCLLASATVVFVGVKIATRHRAGGIEAPHVDFKTNTTPPKTTLHLT